MSKQLHAHPAAKGLIFDLDGTLLDSMPLHWTAWQEACSQLGFELEYSLFIEKVGQPVEKIAKQIVEHYNVPVAPEEIINKKKALVHNHMDKVLPFDVVVNVARENFGKLPMSVGTGSDRARAVAMLQNSGIINLFNAIVAADDVVNHKPHPDTFLKCAELMGIPPSQCQVFEDGKPGLQAGLAAGMIVTDVTPYTLENK